MRSGTRLSERWFNRALWLVASRVYLFEVGLSAAGKLTHTCRHDWAAPGLARLAGAARYTHEVIENYDFTFDS